MNLRPADRVRRPRGRGEQTSQRSRDETARRERARVERQYTAAVRRLLRNPDRLVRVVVEGKVVNVRARDVAAGLMDARADAGAWIRIPFVARSEIEVNATAAEGSLSLDYGAQLSGPDVHATGNANWGVVSVDQNGRASIGIGAQLARVRE